MTLILQGHDCAVRLVKFHSCDSTLTSIGDNRSVYLWNLNGQLLAKLFEGWQETLKSVALSPDGEMIAIGGSSSVYLQNLQGDAIAQPFSLYQYSTNSSMNSLAFSFDGQLVVSGNYDGKVHLWGVQPLTHNEQALVDDWEAILQMACDRLRYHPIFNPPTTAEAQSACEVCQKYVWDRESR